MARMDPKMMAAMAAKKRGMGAGRGAPGAMGAAAAMPRPPAGGMGMMKKGGTAKKMASGGFVKAADGVATKGKTKATMVKMKMGGKAC